MMATTDATANVMKKISKDGSGPDAPSPPVHVAVANKDLKRLQELIQSGAPQLHPKTHETALHVAARTGSMECLRWLLSNNINSPFDKDRNGSTPCHYAAVYGQIEALKALLTHDQQNHQIAKVTDENGLSILALATLQGDITMVRWIVQAYPDLGYLRDSGGNLPIHFAAAGGSLAIVKFLVEQFGTRYAEENDNNHTKPVYYAAQNGKIEVLKYLVITLGVNPMAKEKDGMTAIHAASSGHQVDIAKWLVVQLGPKIILSKSSDGATPLHIAAAQGYTDLLEYFIENLEDKSDINVRDDILATPAHDAAEFGERDSFLILLRNGADITIKDKENKTPFDLALEKNQTDMLAIISDYKEHGPSSLSKYEKSGRSRSSSAGLEETSSSNQMMQRTTEISDVIMEATNLLEKRKGDEITRKKSLQRLAVSDDEVTDTGDELEQQLMKSNKGSRRSRSKRLSPQIPHERGPNGELYAKLNKKARKKKSSDDDVISHTSSAHKRTRLSNGLDDPSIETASNFSRPSRVKHYYSGYDSASSVGSSVSQRFEGRHRHVPGFYPHHDKSGPHSTSGMSMGSSGMHYPGMGYPMPSYQQYPFFPAMVAQYYGYPYPPQAFPYPKPKTTDERMHMEALQKSGRPLFGPRGGYIPPHLQHYRPPYPHHPNYHHPRQPHVGVSKRSRPSSGHSNTRSGIQHKDREIGFGPPGVVDEAHKIDVKHELHPPPPPITKGGKMSDDHLELQSVDENFIMVKPDVEGKVPTQASGGTRLQRARLPDEYDGRFNQFIETDSEEEYELDEHLSVKTLAESALILALGPICGLKGISKVRREEHKESISPETFADIEAQKTAKHWSQTDVTGKTTELEEISDHKQKEIKDLDDWTAVLGISPSMLTTPMNAKELGGSIRARHFAMQELKTSSMHQSLASLDKDEDDDDMISVVIGDRRELKDSKKQKKDSSKKSSQKRNKETSSKSQTVESKGKKLHKKGIKKSTKMTVEATKKSETETNQKEMKLKKEVLPTPEHKGGIVVSSAVKKGKSSEPIEVRNTAILDSSDSEQEKKISKSDKQKKKKVTKDQGKSSGNVNVDDLFAETQKEIEEMLAGIPKSPTTVTGDESRKEMAVSFPDEESHVEQLNKMFPHAGNGNDENVSRLMETLENTSKNVTPQQRIKLQLIQNILAGKDPELMKQLLSLISDGWNPVEDSLESSSNTQLAFELETKLMERQEKQRKETEEHFRNQAEMSETLQKRLEEQAARHMENIQQQLDQQKKLMMIQLEEQRKLLEQERKKKSRKNHKTFSTSSDSDSDTGEVTMRQVTPNPVIAEKNKIKTMTAKIYQQPPLKWEDFSVEDGDIPEPPPLPPVHFLLSNINDPELKTKIYGKKPQKHHSTNTELNQTSLALERFTGGIGNEIYIEDEEDDDEMKLAKAKRATRKRADVLKIN